MKPTIHRLATHTTRSTTRLSTKPPPPSLEHFLQRSRVLTLYRSIVRSIHRIPATKRGEYLAHARGEFERNKHVTDITQIRYLVSTGKTEFDTMARYIEEMAAEE